MGLFLANLAGIPRQPVLLAVGRAQAILSPVIMGENQGDPVTGDAGEPKGQIPGWYQSMEQQAFDAGDMVRNRNAGLGLFGSEMIASRNRDPETITHATIPCANRIAGTCPRTCAISSRKEEWNSSISTELVRTDRAGASGVNSVRPCRMR